MKQKYSEHCPKHETTQPSNLSTFNTATTSTCNLSSATTANSSKLQQTTCSTSVTTDRQLQHQSSLETQTNSKISNKNKTNDETSSKISRLLTSSSTNSACKSNSNKNITKKTNQNARGITKSSSFSLFYNRNANKQNKSTVQRQQSENLPSSYFIRNVAHYRQQHQQPQNDQFIAVQNVQHSRSVHQARAVPIQHSYSLDSISTRFDSFVCPKHGTYPFKLVDQLKEKQELENAAEHCSTSGLVHKKPKTYSLHSMQKIDENINLNANQHHCNLHQHHHHQFKNVNDNLKFENPHFLNDQASQTDENNLEDEYSLNVHQQQKHRNYPRLKNLPPAHSLPPDYYSLPPTTSLKSSSSFPSPQTYLSYHAYYHHPALSTQSISPFLTENNEMISSIPLEEQSSDFYNNANNSITSQYSQSNKNRNVLKSTNAKSNLKNQMSLDFQQHEQSNDQFMRANTSEDYYFCEQEQHSSESTGGIILNAMAEILDDEESASCLEFENLTTNTVYSLGELEEKEESIYRSNEDKLLREEIEREYLEHQQMEDSIENIENDLQLIKQQYGKSAGKHQENYFVSFKNANLPNEYNTDYCQNDKLCKSIGQKSLIMALEHEEDTLHEMNNNDGLNYQLNSQVNDIQEEEEEEEERMDDEIEVEHRKEIDNNYFDNLTDKLTIKKAKDKKCLESYFEHGLSTSIEEEEEFYKEQKPNEKLELGKIAENALTNATSNESTKKRLRESTSTTTDSASLINEKKNKIKKQQPSQSQTEKRAIVKKRNWFLRQISNSSKSSQTNTNCDTCSIVTNQDTQEDDDNVFGEKSKDDNKLELGESSKLNSSTAAALTASNDSGATFNLLNQTKTKLAQLRSQKSQHHSIESDQSALTKTTISITNSNSSSHNLSRQVSRQENESSFGLKNLFRKRKKRMNQQDAGQLPFESNQKQQQDQSNKRLNNSNNNDSKQPTSLKQQQPFKKDKHHVKLKAARLKKVNINQNKGKCIGGIRSRSMKTITHPLERSIVAYFVITLFFTMLAIISGLPIVFLLFSILPLVGGIRKLITCDFRSSFINEHKCTPLEHYWLNSPFKNNCKKDPNFTLEQCRDLIQSRLIQKVGTERFRWILRFKGLRFFSSFKRPHWDRIPVSEFDINQHISALKPINGIRKLKEYIMQLMHVPLDLTNRPGWHIHYVKINSKLNNQVALIIRVHQALFDGVSLSKILIALLSDQVPVMYSLADQQRYKLEYEKSKPTNRFPPTNIPTDQSAINSPFFNNLACSLMKPRFGGFNFSTNLYRACIVGPLTFFLWVLWAVTRRNANFLLSTKFFVKIRKYAKSIDLNSLIEDDEDLINLIENKKSSNFLSVQNQQWKPKRKDQKRDQFNKQKSINSLDQSSSCTHSKFTASTLTTTTSGSKYRLKRPEKAIYWTSTPFASVHRVKQVTRSSLNDVILSCVAGAVRDYLVDVNNISNPPDLGITLPVDISIASDSDMENIGVDYVFLTAPLPTSIESSIPRLWEIRHLMEELKTSADPTVMNGVNYFLHWLLPSCIGDFLLNFIHRNSSVCLSNLQGPKDQITFYTHRVHSINYWMSPPPDIPLCFNILSYGSSLSISISSSAQLIPCAKRLGRLLKKQFHNYYELLAKRRVPGERSRIRALAQQQYAQLKQPIPPAAYLATKFKIVPSISPESTITQIGKELQDDYIAQLRSSKSSSLRTTPSPTTSTLSPTTASPMAIPMSLDAVEALAHNIEKAGISISSSRRNTLISTISQLTTGQLADRLNEVQLHLYDISEQLQEENLSEERKEQLDLKLEEFKDEFGVLMRQIRRRKSIADYSLHSVVINVESEFDEEDDIDEIDAEFRQAKRRFSFGISSRRSSVVSTSAISIPTRFTQVSPPNLPNLLTRRSIIPNTSSSPEPTSSPERTIKEETV